jgi:SulP family sulfate permease
MLATVAVTVLTHDLAQGVLTGVLLSGVFFAYKVGQLLQVRSEAGADARSRSYEVSGHVFFASADRFAASFDPRERLDTVRIDVSRARFWDITAVAALDKVVLKFRREGTLVQVTGLDAASATLVAKFGVHDKDGAALVAGH